MWDTGFNFCWECQQSHNERNDKPKCRTEGKCEQVQCRSDDKNDKRPVFLYGLNYLAWKIYWDTVGFSEQGERGLHTLSNIEFVLNNADYRLTKENYDRLMNKIKIILNIVNDYQIACINKAQSQNG